MQVVNAHSAGIETDPAIPGQNPTHAPVNWQTAVGSDAFRSLIALKERILLPMVILYLVLFLGVCLMAGYARPLMAQKCIGQYNFGYVLIIGTYGMSWLLAVIYVYIADNYFDPRARAAIAALQKEPS
jgi:uncharacterized membrane protein (DUF485 family)